jgi:hypothetical protein
MKVKKGRPLNEDAITVISEQSKAYRRPQTALKRNYFGSQGPLDLDNAKREKYQEFLLHYTQSKQDLSHSPRQRSKTQYKRNDINDNISGDDVEEIGGVKELLDKEGRSQRISKKNFKTNLDLLNKSSKQDTRNLNFPENKNNPKKEKKEILVSRKELQQAESDPGLLEELISRLKLMLHKLRHKQNHTEHKLTHLNTKLLQGQ